MTDQRAYEISNQLWFIGYSLDRIANGMHWMTLIICFAIIGAAWAFRK